MKRITVSRVLYPMGSLMQIEIGEQTWVLTEDEAGDLVDDLRAGIQFCAAEQRAAIYVSGGVN